MTSCQLSSGDLTADRRAHYALQYAEGGDLCAAIDLQTQALELAHSWAAGWHQLAWFREKAGDLTGAAEAWRTVVTGRHIRRGPETVVDRTGRNTAGPAG